MRVLSTRIFLTTLILLLVACIVQPGRDTHPDNAGFDDATETDPLGLKPVDCWFRAEADWPETECYFMQVRENHADAQSRIVSFPLVIFRTDRLFKSANPVLHLGAGGPGAAFHLDSEESIEAILVAYDELSLAIGRDLFVIDPRGAGLSTPLLSCETYVDHEVDRLRQNLALMESWHLSDQDYVHCIRQMKQQGVNFNAYNSASILRDVEALREAMSVKQWVLVGVSYAAVYAQFLARHYPQTVEALILDSPVFPNLKAHHNYLDRVLAPYKMLFKNCGDEDGCASDEESEQLQADFWTLHDDLNENPLPMRVENPYTEREIPVILNGERFLAAVSEGVYGTEIFKELKKIVSDLGAGDTGSIHRYFESYLAFLLDKTYGDLSAEAHYCFEDKPFLDFDLMRQLSDALPAGYIRDTTKLSLDWPDKCDLMGIQPAGPEWAEAVTIEQPTLFLQGALDAITPLSDVEIQQENFQHSELLLFDLSHDILGSSHCAEKMAGYFIQHKTVGNVEAICE